MRNNKVAGLMIILLGLALTLSGQSKKTIREKGITSQTVWEYFIEEGMEEPVVESIERYDEQGELVEIQEFNRLGEIRKWEKYVYDEEGQLVEEVFLDEKGKVERTEKNEYRDGLRVEKRFFNSRGQLYKRKVYEYEYRGEHP
jgi:YD repeat-containing protein